MESEETFLVGEPICSNQKKRTINFSNQEKLSLMELISNKYANTLEDKKTDRASLHLRMTAWKQIEMEYNAISCSGVYRDWATLKRLYDNRKREVKKMKARETQCRFKTGGGPEIKTDLDVADQILLSIMNKKVVEGFHNPTDCDSQPTKSALQELPANDEHEFIFSNMEGAEESEFDSVIPTDYDNEGTMGTTYSNYGKFHGEILQITNHNENTMENYPKWKRASDLQRQKHPALDSPKPNYFSTDKIQSKEASVSVSSSCTPIRGESSNPSTQRPVTAKRRPVLKGTIKPRKAVKILSSSDIAKKYDLLLDRRAVLIEKQIEKINQEIQSQRVKSQLEIELLTIEVVKKKKDSFC